MKVLLLLCCFLMMMPQVFSQQISNNGFENWHSYTGYDVPDSFYTTDQIYFSGTAGVSKSTEAHTGNFAVLLKLGSLSLPGAVQYGSYQKIGNSTYTFGWPFSGRPVKMKFWYKFAPAGIDTAISIIGLTKWNDSSTIVGIGFSYITSSASSYTLAETSIYYVSGSNPDTIYIDFMSGTSKTTPGSMFYIDDISFEYITGVNEIKNIPTNYSLSQNYPNPFNPACTINYSLAKEGNVKLTVYNTIGSKVATILNEYRPAGNYSVNFNGKNLTSGVYFYRIQTGNFIETKKMMLLK